MNANRIVLPLVVALSVVTVADLEAGIFGRRRERIKAEVASQLRYEMQGEIEQKVAAAKAETAAQLSAETTEQIQTEATALKAEVSAALADMRESAKAMLAAEADKLKQETAAELAKLRADAEAKLTAESDKLKKQVETAVAGIKQDATTQIAAATQDLSTQVKTETAKVASQVEASLMPKLEASLTSAIAQHMPKAPADDKQEEKQETPAVLATETNVKEEAPAENK
ncbi:hypothetical protein LOC68_05810 [Blastopirellula sp. JC732]|uniref:Uncharacterized protein n=1 Tax=Blastopirellula sediminis TaxID=2894196 RepID=A0A9X1MIV8_9BACT|nr:hypothetical protein [Blastopirellula sediminis]MCC9609320.1 hypothetical protein [Blastopirellula sediminis]MCC9627903.1 hypothetical protein [Blastopirellula sediminis]